MVMQLKILVNEHDSFKKVVCANGFSFDLGISFIKGILTSYLEILNKWLKYFLRKEMHIKRLIQKYLDFCIDTGICDILDKITKYFNCVLMNGIDSCAAISTASSYYKSALNKLCLAEAGNGTYKINSEDSDRWLATIHSTTATLQDSKQNLDDALAVLVSPSSISAASNAYSLNSTIKGIISATKADGGLFKINNLKKIPIVNYIVVKRKALLEAVREQFGLDSDTSDSEIENKTEIINSLKAKLSANETNDKLDSLTHSLGIQTDIYLNSLNRSARNYKLIQKEIIPLKQKIQQNLENYNSFDMAKPQESITNLNELITYETKALDELQKYYESYSQLLYLTNRGLK
jgi:hypothetical protein